MQDSTAYLATMHNAKHSTTKMKTTVSNAYMGTMQYAGHMQTYAIVYTVSTRHERNCFSNTDAHCKSTSGRNVRPSTKTTREVSNKDANFSMVLF